MEAPVKSQSNSSFHEILYQKRRRTLLTIYILGLTFNPAFSILDYFVAQPHFWSLLVTRIIPAVLCLILYLVYKKDRPPPVWIDTFATAPILLVSAHVARVVYYTGGASSPYAVGTVMMILIIGLYVYCTPKEALVLTSSTAAMYIIASLLAPEGINWGSFSTNSSVLAVLGFMTYNALKTRYRLEEEGFHYQQEIEHKNKELEKANEAKTRFFANLTHEFRTPLVANSTLLEAIKEQVPLTPGLKALLGSATLSLGQMLENVNDLLTQTRSEKGFLEMRWSSIEIVEFIRQSTEVLRTLAGKQNTEIILANNLKSLTGKTLDRLKIYGDRSKLRKIINNLLGNAIKFTHGGKIQVSLSADNQFLKIEVQDSGIGIPAEDLAQIFEPFSQASNNALRDVRGTGLGLSIVKDFITAHQGKIEVKSELGKGTSFEIYLPLGDAHVDLNKLDHSDVLEEEVLTTEQIPTRHADQIINLEEFSQQYPDRYNIAIVEDNPHVMQSLAFVLKDEYNLHFARDGEAGLELVKKIKPDLVLSDIMMPKMNGYELLTAIKSDTELRMIPVILLTAKVDMESKVRGLTEGADEYLSKPFNSVEVRTRIKNFLSHKKLEAEFIQAETMIALGQMTAGISHEILNPIAYAKSSCENIDAFFAAIKAGRLNPDEGERLIKECTASTRDGILRVLNIAEALKGIVRQGAQDFQDYDIHPGIDSSMVIVQANFKSKIHIDRQYELKDKVNCKINQLNQVFLNILSNAAQALERKNGGNIWIKTYRHDSDVYIEIRDDGPGIPKEIQSKIFTPFFTTKEVGQGTGLGLYISQQIVENHNGKLQVESSPGLGATFSIKIPLHRGGEHHEQYSVYDHIDRRMAAVQYPHRR